MRGFFSLRFFRHVLVLHGNAVGGGSIVYGNTLMVPPDAVWDQGTWAGLNDWLRVMPVHYATAKRMLGVTQNRLLAPADLRLKEMAEQDRLKNRFTRPTLPSSSAMRVNLPAKPMRTHFLEAPVPIEIRASAAAVAWSGAATTPVTLDKNYLYLADRNGAQLFAQTKVVDVRPLGGMDDGSLGYEVRMVASAGRLKGDRQRLTCRGVVFAASSLGTQELLLRLKDRGSLSRLSDAVGKRVRTNVELIIGVRYPGTKIDLSQGVAIGSGIYIDRGTDIQVCRYPKGSDAIALISTVQTFGRADWTRAILWLATLVKLLISQPWTTLRAFWPRWLRDGDYAASMHADCRCPYRHAAETSLVLAIRQDACKRGETAARVHSRSQRIRA